MKRRIAYSCNAIRYRYTRKSIAFIKRKIAYSCNAIRYRYTRKPTTCECVRAYGGNASVGRNYTSFTAPNYRFTFGFYKTISVAMVFFIAGRYGYTRKTAVPIKL